MCNALPQSYPLFAYREAYAPLLCSYRGGIRGLSELERMVDHVKETQQKDAVAFSMYPTSMAELFAVADAGMLMPPKSTWFEPKLRSGLFLHML